MWLQNQEKTGRKETLVSYKFYNLVETPIKQKKVLTPILSLFDLASSR